MRALSPKSDRILLTVRMCRDGRREWLNDLGRHALVFYEGGSWWSRADAFGAERQEHPTETEALDALLNKPCQSLRDLERDKEGNPVVFCELT